MPAPDSRSETDLDLVLLGATGFTGGLTAEYLARHAPTGLRWALAGRNTERLGAVRDRLAGIDPDLTDLELVKVDSADAAGLADLARRTRVVITTVGPYQQYGEPLVAACAEAGTDYVDLTGEPEFVDRMYVAHHATAERTGARIVHACGFDSIPHDLGAYYTVQQLKADGPVRMRGVVRASGTASGGTFHSAMGAFSRAREMHEARRARREAEPGVEEQRSKAVAGKPHRDRTLGLYLLPLPTIDPLVVARSGTALDVYGPDFRYSHYAGLKTLRWTAGAVVGISALGMAARVGPLRNLLLGRLQPGDGPDEGTRAKSWFTVDFVAETEDRSLRTRVGGGDPGYGETSKMLAQAALCLAFDDNPATAGCVTTAQAMGENLTARLIAAGITFETLT